MKKAGIAVMVGRPNVGKSTLLNSLMDRKVSITSPKPQTTRFSLQAVYEDDRGQIVFYDTPGIFAKVENTLSAHINEQAEETLKEQVDVILYVVDHTRERDIEENKALGIVRKLKGYKILVINKSDIKEPSFIEQYSFIEDEVDMVVNISALKRKNLNILLDTIFEHLPEGEPLVDAKTLVQPVLNVDSKMFIAELIREKVYLMTRKELPYTVTVIVDEIAEREFGLLVVKARILTTADRYKVMLIGLGGRRIKEIGSYARKELELAANKKVYLDLKVETDPHWMERML